MTSATGSKGFTLVEVLLSVSILAIGLVGVLGGYRDILGSYKRSRLLVDGVSLLEEKMSDREIEIRGGNLAGGSLNGKDGEWVWSTQTKETTNEGWYEIRGEVREEGRAGAIRLDRYVRQ